MASQMLYISSMDRQDSPESPFVILRQVSKIKTYWWNEQPNFGDALNPLLLRELTNEEIIWSPLKSADLVAAGSLLQWVAAIENDLVRPLHVWGSGYMFDEEPPVTSDLVLHHAVRGLKSKTFGSLPDKIALGDPGLLASILIKKPIVKKYSVGIVPHLWHLADPVLGKLKDNCTSVKIIDVRDDPLHVIEAISACEFIFASSLHGLVVADAFDIPNQWIQFNKPLFGGDWKFQDYYSSFNINIQPIRLDVDSSLDTIVDDIRRSYARPNIASIKQRLLVSLPSFA